MEARKFKKNILFLIIGLVLGVSTASQATPVVERVEIFFRRVFWFTGASNDRQGSTDNHETPYVLNPPTPENVNRFVFNTEAHILRVVSFGAAILEDPHFIEEFPQYRTLRKKFDKVIQALLEHDAAKIRMEPEFLHRYHLPSGEEAVQVHLAKYFKINAQTLPTPQRSQFYSVIDTLNSADHEHMSDVLKDLGFNQNERELFDQFEEAIDKTDAYLGRRNELGKPNAQPPSLWIFNDPKDERPKNEKLEVMPIMEYIESQTVIYQEATHFLSADEYIIHRLELSDRPFKAIQRKVRIRKSLSARCSLLFN